MWRPFRKSRPDLRADVPSVPEPDGVPQWVTRFRRFGLPVAAIIVLVLCAPGEQYLARLAGWNYRLSWGMAGLFTLYAGLAAVISTQLPKGARGKTSSIWGAVLSLGLAMGAQPVAHLFVTGWLTASPRAPWALIVIVSSVPPLILGHLLHFAAMPPGKADTSAGQDRTDSTVPDRTGRTPAWATEEKARRAVRPARPVRPSVPRVSLVKADTSAGQGRDTGQSAGPSGTVPSPSGTGRTASLAAKQNMSVRALGLVRAGTDEDTIKDTLRTEFTGPDGTPPKPDSIRKAINRAKDKVSRAS